MRQNGDSTGRWKRVLPLLHPGQAPPRMSMTFVALLLGSALFQGE